MTVSAKKAPLSCALLLAAAASGGCATPEMGTPNLDSCMAPETTEYLFKLIKTTETKFDSKCASAALVRTMATLKDKDGKPDLAAAAVAVLVYGKLGKKEQKLADSMLAAEGTSIENTQDLLDRSRDCRSELAPSGEMRINCPPPLSL